MKTETLAAMLLAETALLFAIRLLLWTVTQLSDSRSPASDADQHYTSSTVPTMAGPVTDS